MPSPLLPVTNRQTQSTKPPPSPDPATTLLLKQQTEIFVDDDPRTKLLTSSSPPIYEDNNGTFISIKPLLTRTSSFNSPTTASPSTARAYYQQRRRRIASDNSLSSLSDDNGRQETLGEEVGHAAAETYLVTRLSLKLLSYLGGAIVSLGPFWFSYSGICAENIMVLVDFGGELKLGYRWIMRFLALGCYAMMLMPGFIQVGYYYFFSSRVLRSIVYGDQPRNRLDLYLPKNKDGPKPVVAFVTGGAWIIGYKAWGSLLGQQLSDRDIMVACIDYRNFPQGTMSDMVKDASEGISFVCNKIAEHGGDPNRVYLMGQSAGAHIGACALVEQAIKEAGNKESVTWSVSQIKAYFGLSGGYNLLNLVDYFHSRGLYRSIFLSIMEGEQSLRRFSPEVIVQDPNLKNAVSILPPIVLFHGTADYSIPSDASKDFAETLQRVGVRAESILYEDKTHTDLFLQDPMRGGFDQMFEDLVTIIHADDIEAQAMDVVATPRRRLVPECMLQVARKVSPF
ncbi:putative isoprenylcysteine alpha-carbonyl methylesterase icmel1 [Turnera subulata]|uniref:protein-S-isoprenylcysteine alpha-carbonyl methylesterase n=1 Tax=Turnera subulata TaxID=218843 RepID=A0A9Q0GEJ8_9ROSI|nr:putative isoprenylcysteine alpha-carbonyl methylesterase icmel1 [Turnera subulata]